MTEVPPDLLHEPFDPAAFGLDADLLARLARLATRHDPVTADVLAGARAAYTWRSIDAELAELVYDSVLDEDALAGVRGGSARQLTFEGPDLTIELELPSSGRVVGQLVPPQPGTVEVLDPSGSLVVDVDHLGRFAADVRTGPVRLRCRPAGRGPGDPDVVGDLVSADRGAGPPPHPAADRDPTGLR